MEVIHTLYSKKYCFLCIVSFIATLLISACTGEVNGVPEERTVPDASISQGSQLITQYGCGACHSIPGIVGADAMAAPPLDHFYQRTYIAGRLTNTLDNLINWIQNPQEIEPGTAMPDLGVSETEARDMAAYLYHQPNIIDILGR
jgi:cytochrome c